MPHFPSKRFNGRLYSFDHLIPSQHKVTLDAAGTAVVQLYVTFSTHCFTKEFDPLVHRDHHRYIHAHEIRAFDLTRYECSLCLPAIVANLARVRVYRTQRHNYTYVAQIYQKGQTQPYSLFFTLKRYAEAEEPTVHMYVQSAYLKPLTINPNAQSWRFGSLVGQLTGVFPPSAKKGRPKKKAP